MPIIKQVRQSRIDQKSAFLTAYAKNITSQCGEDGITEKIFEVIGTQNKWCVEFGAWDGKLFSNTYNLVQHKGWHGVLVEGNPERFKELTATYAGNHRAHLVCKTVGFDQSSNSLDYILASIGDVPKDLDLVSIDIDGNDYFIFESLVEFKPRVVVIEFNPTIPNDVFFLQDQDFEINQGCSLRALIDLGKAKGYELAVATAFNAFFVPTAEFLKLGIEDNSIDAMYSPMLDGRIFHGYDGTVFCAGMDRLIWHGTTVAPDSLQILPAERRFYGDRLPSRSRERPAFWREPEPIERPGVDIARGKPATQSSLSQWSKPNDAQGAVNGTPTGFFGFCTRLESNPWWQVDLETNVALDEVLVFNRLDCERARAYSFVLKLGLESGEFHQVHAQGGVPFGGIDGMPARIKLDGAVARYVRIELPHEGYLHLDAVEVYARPT